MRWVWLTLTTLAVVAAAAAPFWSGGFWGKADTPANATHGPARVELERSYYIFLAALEVEPKDADGDFWDLNDSAPDLYYQVFWQGQRVFQSSAKSDTLVAKWSSSAIRIGDLLEAVSIDDSIKAARITARTNTPIEIAVFDKDVAGDDEIARWTVDPTTLHVTDQRAVRPAPGIVSVVYRVLALDGVKFRDIVK